MRAGADTEAGEARRGATTITIVAAVLALISAGATLERSHYQATHPDLGPNSMTTTPAPAPAQQAVFPSGAPDAVLRSSPTGGVSLSQSPPTASSDFDNSIVVAQVHSLTAIAAVKACAARHGTTANCTKATPTSLGTDTGLTIVHAAPQVGEVRVIHRGPVYSATAAAARGVWYAVTVNVQTGAESRTCLSHHGKQRCAAPNW